MQMRFLHRLSVLSLLLLPCILLNSCGASLPTGNSSTSSTPTSGTQIRPFIDTWENIHLAQSFDYAINDPAAIAKYYDFIWGASPGKVAAYRAGNPAITLSYYISFFRDSGVFGNVDAHHNLTYWQKTHPDWILYQCDRQTPAYEDGQTNVIPFDFSNPAVVQWEAQTYALPASQNGYDALAADNVNMENLIGACGFYKHGQWVQRYTGDTNDPQWRADVLAWLTNMQQALHALSHPLALIPNLGIGAVPLTDPIYQQIIHHVDGILDEGGFTNYADGFLTDNAWIQKIHFIDSVQQQGKACYIVNELRSPPLFGAEAESILASYLMAKQHSSAVFISLVQQYGRDLRSDWYKAQIGNPSDEMYQGQGVYWRDYTHGLSIFNASSTTRYTIKLPGQYDDIQGYAMGQTITLAPHSGLVLLD